MRQRPLSPLILTYHALGDVPLTRDWFRLFVRPRELRQHVRKLRAWGYRIVTFGELAAAAPGGGANGLAALTFDDGFSDNLSLLVPIVKELNAPATVFVIAGWIGRSHPDAPWARIATADEVRALHDAGLEIGAHTMTHRDLTTLGYEEALSELAESRTRLSEIVGASVDVAAYPYGATNETVVAACRAAGFAAACGTRGRGSWDDPHNLPRQDVGNRQTRFALYLKHKGLYERVATPIVPLLQTPPGRLGIKVIRHLRSW